LTRQRLTRRVEAALRDPVSRDWAIVTAGSLARLAVGFVSSILIARALGPADFGIFAVLAAVGNIAGAVADLGLTDAAVKRIASTWPDERDVARVRAGTFFWLRLAVTLLVVLIGLSIAMLIPDTFLPRSGTRGLLLLALLGVAATGLSGTVAALLQATKQFGRLSIVGLTNAVLTAVLAATLIVIGQLNLVSALVVLGIGTSLVSFIVGVRLLPTVRFLDLPDRPTLRAEGGELIRLGRWLGISNVFAMVTAQLDVLLLGRWSAPSAVGLYALALNLATKVDVVNGSLYTVLLPTASSLVGAGAVSRYVRRGLLRSALISLAIMALIPLIGPIVGFFYGSAYLPAVPLFQLLLGVVIFDVFTMPVVLLTYHYNRPRLLAGADVLRAGTLAATASVLIPRFGPVGAIAAKLGAKIAGAALTAILLALRRDSGPTPQ
jgi:O-antigen/teichoic acid export membrane protein